MKSTEKDSALSKIRSAGMTVVRSSSVRYQAANTAILKQLVSKNKFRGIYVTLVESHSKVVERLKKENVGSKSLFFIDGASKTCTDGEKDHVLFFSGPEALTELSIAITNVADTGLFSFIVLDSLSTIQLYNNFETSARFARFLTSKLKLMGLSCVVLSLAQKEADRLGKMIEQFADEVLDFK